MAAQLGQAQGRNGQGVIDAAIADARASLASGKNASRLACMACMACMAGCGRVFRRPVVAVCRELPGWRYATRGATVGPVPVRGRRSTSRPARGQVCESRRSRLACRRATSGRCLSLSETGRHQKYQPSQARAGYPPSTRLRLLIQPQKFIHRNAGELLRIKVHIDFLDAPGIGELFLQACDENGVCGRVVDGPTRLVQ